MSPHPIARWHEIVAQRDASALDTWLHEDVVFYSPVVHTPQRGRMLTSWYLTAAMYVFGNETFRYVRQIVGERDAMLEFETTIEGIVVNGVDIISWDDEGQVVQFKVMVRPLKGIQLIHEQMRAMLEGMRA